MGVVVNVDFLEVSIQWFMGFLDQGLEVRWINEEKNIRDIKGITTEECFKNNITLQAPLNGNRKIMSQTEFKWVYVSNKVST